MPELPEIETVCRGLSSVLPGERLTNVLKFRDNLRFPIPRNLTEKLRDKIVKNITRRAKYVLVHLDDGYTLILHLGMSGRVIVHNKKREKRDKHDHVIFYTESGLEIVFNDPRRFGMVDIAHSNEIANHKCIKHLGIEPLSDKFNGKYLHELLKGRKTPIKLAIMNAALIVGVGNIYACESLFRSKILPARAASSLSGDECSALASNIKVVLQEAIKAGGSTLRDYVTSSGESGYFQHHFKVYGREKEQCICCHQGIVRIVQGGRSTFFCKNCQK